jgi:hypothetical protein
MVNVLLSLDDDLAARLDAEARAAGVSLSRYLERLVTSAQDTAQPVRHDTAAAAIDRIRAIAAKYPCTDDSTELVRHERDAAH